MHGDDPAATGDPDRRLERPPRTDGGEDAADEEANPTPNRETVELNVRPGLLATWRKQARMAKLDLDEFVERMVEAGRMSVNVQPTDVGSSAAMTTDDIAEEVRDQLRTEEYCSWEELLDAVSGKLEENLERALSDLQEEGVVRYSGLHGGYVLVEEEHR